jgi:hypothetical protein
MIATMVVVQFETAEAIARADEIFSVGGVDMALTGANHLMADLGIPSQYEHEKVCDAYATAIAAAQRNATASMSASVVCRANPHLPRTSSIWEHATSRLAPISLSCLALQLNGRERVATPLRLSADRDAPGPFCSPNVVRDRGLNPEFSGAPNPFLPGRAASLR